ncbi:MAG: hypothetical protein G8237_00540 [Magnetococcales bacterium]|nr:hypothetical protein [Magnetococcales bacterium]NGZ04827.1 hypothetical protein [Magnetococcales bacterium]
MLRSFFHLKRANVLFRRIFGIPVHFYLFLAVSVVLVLWIVSIEPAFFRSLLSMVSMENLIHIPTALPKPPTTTPNTTRTDPYRHVLEIQELIDLHLIPNPTELSRETVKERSQALVNHFRTVQHDHSMPTEAEIEKTINRFIQSMDKYGYYEPPRVHPFPNNDKSTYGIGVQLFVTNNQIILVPAKGGSADKAGLSDAVILKRIEDQPVYADPSDKAIARLDEALKKKTIKISIKRFRAQNEEQFKLQKKTINNPSTETRTLSSNGKQIPYLRILNFSTKTTHREITQYLANTWESPLPIILDLRYCTGGDLYESLDAVSLFVQTGTTLIYTEDVHGGQTEHQALSGEKKYLNERIVLLVGPLTASSCEIFAQAMTAGSEPGRVRLIGGRTYGKCLAQKSFPLSNAGQLVLTNLKVLSHPDKSYCPLALQDPKLHVTEEALWDMQTIEACLPFALSSNPQRGHDSEAHARCKPRDQNGIITR